MLEGEKQRLKKYISGLFILFILCTGIEYKTVLRAIGYVFKACQFRSNFV